MSHMSRIKKQSPHIFAFLLVAFVAVLLVQMSLQSQDALYCYSLPETTEYLDQGYVYYRDDGVVVKAYHLGFVVDCPGSISNP